MNEDGPAPWEEAGAHRLDLEPHRAEFLRWLACISSLMGVLAMCLFVTAFVGLVLGLVVIVLAYVDLRGMRAAKMDPTGMDATKEARRIAYSGIIMSGIWLALWGLFVLPSLRW